LPQGQVGPNVMAMYRVTGVGKDKSK